MFSDNDKIEKLNLSNRVNNVLHRHGIHTIKSFVEYPSEEFMFMLNLGSKSLAEIMECRKLISEGGYTVIDNVQVRIKDLSEDVKIFIHSDGKKYVDVRINDMILSARASKCLQSEGYSWLSEIIVLNREDLENIKNMGGKSINETMKIIKCFKPQLAKEKDESGLNSDNLCSLIYSELSEFMHINGREHYANIIDICDLYIESQPANIESALSDVELLSLLYSNDYIKEKYCAYIVELIKEYKYGLKYQDVLEKTPAILCDEKFINDSITHLIDDDEIESVGEGKYIGIFDSFIEGTKNILTDREYDIFIKRTQNLTLEQIGTETGLTRERIRQIEAKALKKIEGSQKIFKEDIYVDIFNEYEMTAKEFNFAFQSEQTYYYLIMRYAPSKGSKNIIKKPLIEALTDDNIPEKMRRAIEKAVYRNYVKLDTEYVPCTRPDITNYVLKTFATNEIKFDDFAEIYLNIVEDIEEKGNEKLSLMDRGYENRLANSNTVLWKYGKRLRYYNIQSYDFENLLQTLNLQQYNNVEYSTRKFFNLYPETMKDYDIRDEYELHNLLKKLYLTENVEDINFSRMPNVEFGKIDRNEQVLNLLLTLAPVSNTDFAKAYEEEYGVLAATVLANYMKDFDEYFYDGIYKIDAPLLTNDISSKMKKLLTDDFYLIDDIKKIYVSAFPDMDISFINPFSIKTLGFKVYSSYAISDIFSTATDYVNHLLLHEDIVYLDNISSDIKQLIQFTSQLYKLRSDYSIVEFTPNKYIKYERLEKNGLTRNRIFDFNKNVFDFVGQGKYFTIHSILKDGFKNDLEEYGFDDWFYSSLLVECKNEVSYMRIGGNKLFILGNVRLAFEDFIEYIIFDQENLSMEIYDLKELLLSQYNINVTTYKLIETSKNTSMHYDAISEKIYADYDIYYEEI